MRNFSLNISRWEQSNRIIELQEYHKDRSRGERQSQFNAYHMSRVTLLTSILSLFLCLVIHEREVIHFLAVYNGRVKNPWYVTYVIQETLSENEDGASREFKAQLPRSWIHNFIAYESQESPGLHIEKYTLHSSECYLSQVFHKFTYPQIYQNRIFLHIFCKYIPI